MIDYQEQEVVFCFFIDGERVDVQMALIEYVGTGQHFAIPRLVDIQNAMDFNFSITDEMQGKWIRVGFRWVIDNDAGNYFLPQYTEIMNE